MMMRKNITTINRTIANRKNIDFLFIHYVGAVSSAWDNSLYFKSVFRGASAHYFVDSDEIVQVVEDKDISWHTGTTGAYYHPVARNSNSIGIEMCCEIINGKLGVSQSVEDRTIALVRDLMKKYSIPASNVLRHWDITRKGCPATHINAHQSRWDDFKRRIGAEVPSTPEAPKSIIIRSGIVTPTIGLRIRSGAGTGHMQIGLLERGTRVDIYEIRGNWGRIHPSSARWICLDYIQSSGAAVPNVVEYQVKTSKGLNVRAEPSTTARIVKALPNGTKVDVFEIRGNWGRITSGWISLEFARRT